MILVLVVGWQQQRENTPSTPHYYYYHWTKYYSNHHEHLRNNDGLKHNSFYTQKFNHPIPTTMRSSPRNTHCRQQQQVASPSALQYFLTFLTLPPVDVWTDPRVATTMYVLRSLLLVSLTDAQLAPVPRFRSSSQPVQALFAAAPN